MIVKSWLVQGKTVLGKDISNPLMVDTLPKSGWYINSPCFKYKELIMVFNPPWNLPFLGAQGLTSPEQTATGKGISNPFMAIMVCQKPYGIQLTNVSCTES